MKTSSNPGAFLGPEEVGQVESAVREAEERTSAEIKVVLLRHAWHDIRWKAARIFRKLGLDKTRERNAVLILVVTANREFLIYGGAGIHERVGLEFWDDVRDGMADAFKAGRFGDGIVQAVRRVGDSLAEQFPHRTDDRNEIPDDVVEED